MEPNPRLTASGGIMNKFLRAFADVRPGESRNALLLALNIFLILTAYYVLKPVREALILNQGSAELKSYLSAGQVVLLAFLIPLYARLVARVSRRHLVNIVTAIFALCLLIFYVLGRLGTRLDIPFFLWIGIFNMMIVAQFWGFANDIYSKDEGERLFPIVGFGASVGAVFGSRLAARLIAPFGIYELMLLGCVLLVLQAVITNLVDRNVAEKRQPTIKNPPAADPAPGKSPSPGHNSFKLVLSKPYLLSMGLMILLLNWVNSMGEYILGNAIRGAAQAAVVAGNAGGLSVEQLIGQVYAQYFSLTNVCGLLLQLFIVSRLVKYLGVPVCVAILPCISLVSYNVLAFFPVIRIMVAAKVAENSTDYSLNNTVKNMLFLPCSREEKYSAKQVIDSFLVRLGDVLTAVLVFFGTSYLKLSARGVAIINVVLVLGWLVLAIRVGRNYRALTSTQDQQLPAQADAKTAGAL
jgi:ATP:ADP antiporter, AAA family